jgi:hypothetical protein
VRELGGDVLGVRTNGWGSGPATNELQLEVERSFFDPGSFYLIQFSLVPDKASFAGVVNVRHIDSDKTHWSFIDPPFFSGAR